MFEKLRENLWEKFEYWNEDIRDEDVMDFYESCLRAAINGSTSFKLYRYMPPTYFNIRNIEIQKIHLSSNGVMNDVYEGIPVGYEKITYKEVSQLNDMAYMTCMSETRDNVVMWSHYAQSHKGICVEYDLKRLKEEKLDILKHIFPVVYAKKRLMGKRIMSLVDSHKELSRAIEDSYIYDAGEELDDILPMFLVKGKPWEYEKEWRVVYTKKQMYDMDGEELYDGNIDFKCISAIYLGYRIHPEVKKNILEISERLNNAGMFVEVFQMDLAEHGYDIREKKINGELRI